MQSDESFGGCRNVSGREEALDGLFELILPRVLGVHEGAPKREQKVRVGLADRPDCERRPVEARGFARRGERPCSIAGLVERLCGRRTQVVHRQPRRGAVLDRTPQVVGEHLGAVLGPIAGQRRDPVGRATVLSRTVGTWNLAVGGVADECVDERVLPRTLHGRLPLAPHEFLAFEGEQPRLERPRLLVAHCRQTIGPEDLAEHGCRVEEPLLVVR